METSFFDMHNYCDCFEIGEKAPDFTLDAVVRGEQKRVSLSDYKGKWVVLFFYASDFTFVWPTELAAVAVKNHLFRRLGAYVLGISTDSVYSHKIFLEISPSGRKVNYPLLSDRPHEVSAMYKVLNENEGLAYRGTFIIDPEGTIQAFAVNPQPVGRNIDEVLRILEALQFSRKTGLRAPAGWEPGDPGIRADWELVGKY